MKSTSPAKVRLGIVGCGAVVDELYLDPLLRFCRRGWCDIAAVVDVDRGRAERLAARFRRAEVFEDVARAVRETVCEAVLVATPPRLHSEHAIAALTAGAHVLCEKPMACTLEDAWRMERWAQSSARKLVVGMPRRFVPNFAELASRVRAGELGDSLQFLYREGDFFYWRPASAAMFQREKAGGGVLIDKGVHGLDLLIALFGEPKVESFQDDSLRGGVETRCRLRLEFAKARGAFELSWTTPMPGGLWIRGSRGEAVLPLGDMESIRLRYVGGVWETVMSDFSWPGDLAESGGMMIKPRHYFDCIEAQLIGFLRAVRLGHGDVVPARDGVTAIETIQSAYSMASCMPMRWLSEREELAYRGTHWRREV